MNLLEKNSNVLIDGNALMHRYHHGRTVEVNSKGMEVHATKGFLSLVWRLKRVVNPRHVMVAFDARGKNFRHCIFPDYKAHREPMPDALFRQFRPVYLGLKFLGIPAFVIEGVEADDVLGTLSRQFKGGGSPSYILTMDKDLLQLVDTDTHWLNAKSFDVMTIDGVQSRYGVAPESFADLLAIVGDSADNIPGVQGVGLQTAAQWLNRYGSLDLLIENRHWLKGKVGDAFRSRIEQVRLNRQLTRIKTDVPLPPWEQLPIRMPEFLRLCEVYELDTGD